MSPFLRYPLILGIVTALSGAALYATYAGTQEAAEEQKAKARVQALGKIFPRGFGATEDVMEETKDGKKEVLYTKVWLDSKAKAQGTPDAYAIVGSGVGYNGAVPIRLVAAFADPSRDPDGKRTLLGWSVMESEETPGLGEKIKESRAPYTLGGWLTGSKGAEMMDLRTDFQKQFHDPEAGRSYTASELSLAKSGGPIDAITGATFTSLGVIAAIQDADTRLTRFQENAP